jgi:hypothetical protein
VRVHVVALCALVLVASVAVAEELSPEQARALVVGKLFAYSCFDGTSGMGRIFADGSVVGTITLRGSGEARFAALPAGTVKADGNSICAHLSGLPIEPCFRVRTTGNQSFRGSITGLDFAYCDFYPPTQQISSLSKPAATSMATLRKPLVYRQITSTSPTRLPPAIRFGRQVQSRRYFWGDTSRD